MLEQGLIDEPEYRTRPSPSRSSSTRSRRERATRSRTSSTTSSSGSCRTPRSVRRARTATSCCSPAGCGSRPRSIPSPAAARTRSARCSPIRATRRRDDRDRPSDRLRTAMVGGKDVDYWDDNLRRRAGEPGDGRHRAAARLGVQAVRAGRGAGERHLAEHGLRRAVLDRDPPGQRHGVGRLERRGQQLRRASRWSGHDLVREHGVRPADQPTRRPRRWSSAPSAWASAAASA